MVNYSIFDIPHVECSHFQYSLTRTNLKWTFGCVKHLVSEEGLIKIAQITNNWGILGIILYLY